MTRAKVPYIDDFTDEPIPDDETRYGLEITKSSEKRGQFIKSNKLDLSHSSFKKMVLDKIPDGRLHWYTITKQPDGTWETVKA